MSSSNWLFLAAFCIWFTIVQSAPQSGENLQSEGELIFTHVFYRHGDRNPIQQNPGDKYDISYWPEGWGQLTTLGKQQQYALGQWLRRRYDGFLSRNANVSDIYIQSSDVDRTLMSAEVNLAGLYPPEDDQVWNNQIPWRPIPLHVLPASIDYITGGTLPACQTYDNAYNTYLASADLERFQESAQPFYDYITANTGVAISDPTYLLLYRDSWLIETIHNLPISTWAKSLFDNNEEFYRAAMEPYSFPAATKFLAKFRSGYLLKDMLDRFTSKIQQTLSPDRTFWIYSTHDSVLFSFLQSLDISNNDFVPYTAAIILELRKFDNLYYVQIFYKNSDETPDAIDVPGCGTTCLLSDLYTIYDDILPKSDFDTECQNNL